MTGRKRPGLPGSRHCGAAASLASFGRGPYGRELLPRTAPPPPAATDPHRNAPDAAPREQGQAVARARCAGRRETVTGTEPERRALSGAAPPAPLRA